jgi:hypothetical protein
MHRIIGTLVAFGLFLGIGLASQAGDNDADAIIDKAIKAQLGTGKDAKKQGYRGKNKGTLFIAGMELEFVQAVTVMMPTKFKDVMTLTVANNKVEIVTVFNGKEGWIKAGAKEIKVEKEILEELKDVAALMSISQGVFVRDKSLKFAIIGEAMANGKPNIGVKVSREGKKAIDMYFDKTTNLLTKVERRKRDLMNGQEVTEERIILEYQKQGERMHPKRVLVNVDGKKLLEAEVLDSQFSDTIDDGEFVRP